MPAALRSYAAVKGAMALAVAAVAALAGVLVSDAEPAFASHIGCGDAITADAQLDSDLVDCPNNGIVIGADGITLNLNGHTVDGDEQKFADCPEEEVCDAGILVRDHTGVAVTGGRVTQFATGVFDLEAKRTRLARLHISHNRFNGVLFVASTRSRLVRSTVERNGLETDFPGIAVVAGSSRIVIAHNASKGNADLGLWLEESNNNRIVGNDFSDNPEAGMIVGGDGNDIVGNRVNGNGDGIILAGAGNTVIRNRITRSFRCGHGCGNGISLEDGRGNLVAHNDIHGASETGIRVLTFGRAPSLVATRVRGNSVSDVDGRGVLIGSNAKHTVLSRNRVRGSRGNGIAVGSDSTRVAANHSNHNGGHGIVAVAGITDRGGNTAHGNGKRPQCVHVACG